MAEEKRNWLQRVFNYGDIAPADPRRTIRYLPLPIQAAGITLTYDTALQLSVVWACIDAVTKALASSSWKIFEQSGRKRTARPDDPMYWLLNTRPNPETTAIAFKESLMFQAMTWGNSYAEIVRDQRGQVVELWPLFSDRMIPRRIYNLDGSVGRLVYDYYQFTGGWVTLEAQDCIHIRGPSVNGLLGENMIARAAKAIALGVAAERFCQSYFANGTILGTVLKYPKTLTPEAHRRLKEDWMDSHSGPDKANRPVILEGGMDIVTIAAKPDEMDLVNERKYSLEEICRFFGVPPHKVQHLDRATFNNIEHLGLEFVRDALTPWALRLEQEVDFKCFPQRQPWRHTKLDTAWLSHADALTRAQSYAIYREWGIMSANDVLEAEGRNTIGPEGDIRIIPLNYTSYEGIDAQVEKIQADTNASSAKADHSNAKADQLRSGASSGDGSGSGESFADGIAEQDAPGPETGDDGGSAAEDPAKKSASAGKALRMAVHDGLTGTLMRYQKRGQNREADLRRARKGDIEVQAALAEDRAFIRPKVVEDLDGTLNHLRALGNFEVSMADLLLTLDRVDAGEASTLVASELIEKLCPTPSEN